MRINELYKIFKDNHIPNNALLLSDSGWECSATEMDGIVYNSNLNVVVFLQNNEYIDKKYNNKDWKLISI